MSDTDFGAMMEPVARHFWGEPPKGFVTKVSLRWGNNGSKSVDLQKGTWFDHQAGEGGGVLDLVMRETGADKAGAVEWLETEGFLEPRPKANGQQKRASEEPPPPYEDGPPEEPAEEEIKKPVKGYDYTDRDGNQLYQVVRYHFFKPDGSPVLGKTGSPKKTFLQRRRDAAGNVVWNLDGIGHTIFRHPQVEIAIAEGKTILLPEGEKDVETLEEWGLVGSTNSGGAANWTPALAELFRGADVVVLGDDDDAGRRRVETICSSLRGIARRVRAKGSWGGPKDVTDWKEAGGTAEQLQAIVDALPEWTPAAPASKFGAKRGRDIGGSRIVYDWLVKGLIERGGVFIVAGEKQAGKSFFVIDLGLKVSLNVPYGKGDGARLVKQGLVVYLAAEDRKGVEMRYEGWRRDQKIPADQDVPFVIMGGEGKFSLMDDQSVGSFIEECLAWERFYGVKLELIFIDTFSRATEGLDEIHSGEVGKVLGRVNRIAERTKAAVGLVHHFNGEGRRVRGHSSLTANVSQVIEIRQMTKPQPNRNLPAEMIKDSGGRVVRQAILEKNKNGDNQLKWRFVLRKVDLGTDEDGFPITTCVLDTPSSEVSEGDVRSRLQGDQKLVFDALLAAIEDDMVDLPAGVRTSVKRGTTEQAFTAAVRKVVSFKAPETEPEKRNAELAAFLKRNVTALLNAGWVGRDTDHKVLWSLGKENDRPRRQPKAQPAPQLPEDVRASFAPGEPPF